MSRHASAKSQLPKENGSLNRNQRRRNRTRQQLLDSTSALLIEMGYDALTVQDITDDADVARATFYIHFRDIEEAVWVILEEHFAQLLQLLSTLDEPDPERWRYLKFIGLFKYVAAHKQFMNVMLSEKGHIKLRQRIVHFMAESLEGDLTSGKVARATELPIEFEANFCAGAILQVISWWLTDAPKTSPQELANMVYIIILRQPPPTI